MPLARAAIIFQAAHGRWPDLISPSGYNERLFWMKFFGNIPLPSSGNKLETARFIPPSVKAHVSVPEVVWQSAQPLLPANDAIAPGQYFFKANYGSGYMCRLECPLSAADRRAAGALARRWARRGDMKEWGEWGYFT